MLYFIILIAILIIFGVIRLILDNRKELKIKIEQEKKQQFEFENQKAIDEQKRLDEIIKQTKQKEKEAIEQKRLDDLSEIKIQNFESLLLKLDDFLIDKKIESTFKYYMNQYESKIEDLKKDGYLDSEINLNTGMYRFFFREYGYIQPKDERNSLPFGFIIKTEIKSLHHEYLFQDFYSFKQHYVTNGDYDIIGCRYSDRYEFCSPKYSKEKNIQGMNLKKQIEELLTLKEVL